MSAGQQEGQEGMAPARRAWRNGGEEETDSKVK